MVKDEGVANELAGDLQDRFPGPGWWFLPLKSRTDRNFLPNQVAQNPGFREIAIVLRRSARGGFSIAATAIKYYAERVRAGSIREAYVVLMGDDGKVLGVQTVLNVERNVSGHAPNVSTRPDWAPYYWLKEDFQVSSIKDFRNREEEEEVW